MAKLIYERALRMDENGNVVSYRPERWKVSHLVKELITAGPPIFGASYMNDPSGLEGNVLKVHWLRYYLPAELEAARSLAGIARGVVHCGIYPTQGGEGTNPDYMGLMAGERIQNHYYLTDFHMVRKPVDEQAQTIEDWLDLQLPDFCVIEETSSRGFVYAQMTTAVNDGAGTKYSVNVEKPQDVKASLGGKKIRSQWGGFPSGHDDLLDAAYWSQYSAFKVTPAVSVVKNPDATEVRLPLSTNYAGEQDQERRRTVLIDSRGREIRGIGQWRRRPRLSMFR